LKWTLLLRRFVAASLGFSASIDGATTQKKVIVLGQFRN